MPNNDPTVSMSLKEFNTLLEIEAENNKKLYRELIRSLWNLRHYDQHTKDALKNNIKFFREYLQGYGYYIGKTQAQVRFLKSFKEAI